MQKQTQQESQKLLPIISITLFFALWFADFSYSRSFHDIFSLFSGKIFFSNADLYSKIGAVLLISGLGIIFWPRHDNSPKKWGALSTISFILFALMNLPDFPRVANHDIMLLLLSAGYFIIAARYFLSGRFSEILTNMDYVPLARAFLIIMYFFGAFHKINSGFLNVDAGCWRSFYGTIPFLPDFFLDPKIALYLGGYGTIVLEFVAMALLLSPKTKYYGMLIGMPFHFLIGITGTGTVAHFSALAFALHMAFLCPNAIDQFKQSKIWTFLNKRKKGELALRSYLFLFIVICLGFSWFCTITPELTRPEKTILIKAMWVFYAIPIMVFVALYGRTQNAKRPPNFFLSRVWLANIVSLLLIFNSITAYIGLKSNADLAMFSNLRTEWGTTNHFIIKKPLPLFHYLDKSYYIRILSSSYLTYNSPYPPESYYGHVFRFTKYYQKRFPDYAENKGKHWIKYVDSEGNEHFDDGTQEDSILNRKVNWWVRNYLVFSDFVDLTPRPCSTR